MQPGTNRSGLAHICWHQAAAFLASALKLHAHRAHSSLAQILPYLGQLAVHGQYIFALERLRRLGEKIQDPPHLAHRLYISDIFRVCPLTFTFYITDFRSWLVFVVLGALKLL